MEPLYFGRRGRRLFGLYHPAVRRRGRERGVVLCYPQGQEYIRAHRSFLQLASRLAEAGMHCLRFDYFATGDSEGDAAEGSFDHWVDDAGLAADELAGGAGVESVSFVGLRLGARIALGQTARRAAVDGLVAWSPVVDAVEYRAELEAHQAEFLRGSFARSRGSGHGLEVLGFPVTDQMLALPDLERTASVRRSLVIHEGDAPAASRFAAHLEELGASVETTQVEEPPVWRKGQRDINDQNVSTGLVPGRLLDRIVEWLAVEER